MKKSVWGLMLAGCVVLSTACPVLADSGKVQIQFKVGEDTLSINGKAVKVEKPFVKNGTTLVPLRVITEAFGAKVDWNGSDRSITLNYNGEIIRLVVDKKQALIDGKEKTLLEAPVIKTNITMVPLRFISENFGAKVDYESSTAKISVVKEAQEDTTVVNNNAGGGNGTTVPQNNNTNQNNTTQNNTADGGNKAANNNALVPTEITKEKVGDSYCNWFMNYPKGLKMIDRKFDGTATKLRAEDESYWIDINVFEKSDETFDSLIEQECELDKDLTLISKGVEKKDGVEYAKVVAKGKSVYDTRYFIGDDKIYMVSLGAKDYEKYKSSTVYTCILDSFKIGFNKDGSIEDLAGVNNQGYKTYSDNNLKFSIDISPKWYQNTSQNKPNSLSFQDYSQNTGFNDTIAVQMYSKENSFTLEAWANKISDKYQAQYKTSNCRVIKQEDSVINGVKCKRAYCSMDIDGVKVYTCDALISGENYKYDVSYAVKADTYNDKAKLSDVENQMNSFKFTEPDSAKVGNLSETQDSTASE